MHRILNQVLRWYRGACRSIDPRTFAKIQARARVERYTRNNRAFGVRVADRYAHSMAARRWMARSCAEARLGTMRTSRHLSEFPLWRKFRLGQPHVKWLPVT